MRNHLTIYCPKRKRRLVSFAFFLSGLKWDRRSLTYYGEVSEEKYKKIARLCDRHKLKYSVTNGFSERSTDYRVTFYRANRPAIGKYYFCTYCGKLIKGKTLTVDHIYPVYQAQHNIALQNRLKKRLSTINDAKNLVPACFNCNRKKGTKMGFWIFRANIGKYPQFWYIVHAIRLIAVFSIIVLVFICTRGNVPGVAGHILTGTKNLIRSF